MRNTVETRLGIFVALAIIAAVFVIEIVGGVELFRRGYHVHADFKTVQELKVGDRVKVAGVEVGRVESMNLDETNNKVRVTMKIRNKVNHEKVTLRTDSIATVKFAGLLGQNFVSLTFGSPNGVLATDGTVLQSKEQPDLSAMMEKVDNVASGVENMTKSFTGIKIDKLLGPLINTVEANQAPLTATISNINNITAQIAAGKGTIGRLINDDTLYTSALASVTNLQDAAGEIRMTIADARKIVDQVNSGQGTVGKLLKDDALYNETTLTMTTAREALTNAKEILQKINQGQGTVGSLINDKQFLNNAKLSLQKLDKATEGLEDQGPLSVLGIVVNNLF